MKHSCSVLLTVLVISAIIGSLCWTYSINTWLIFFEKEPVIKWYHGLLIGCIPYLGQIALPVAAVTWIAMLFLK